MSQTLIFGEIVENEKLEIEKRSNVEADYRGLCFCRYSLQRSVQG